MNESTSQPGSADEVVGESPPFPTPWPVKTNKDVERFRVRVPRSTLQGNPDLPTDYEPRGYLRLEVQRRWFRIWHTQGPVLVPTLWDGSLKDELLVSTVLEKTIKDCSEITVSAATRKAFRRYRFIHSGGPVFIAVASVIGALLVALGALWWGHDLGYGLVAGGTALTVLSVIGVMVATYRAPD